MQHEDDILGPDDGGLPGRANPRKADSPTDTRSAYVPSMLPPVKEVAQFVGQVSDLLQGLPKQVSLDEVQRLANRGSTLIRASSKQFASGRYKEDPLNDLKSQSEFAGLLTQNLRQLSTRLARIYHEPSDRICETFLKRIVRHAEALGSDPFFSSRSYSDQVENGATIARWELKFDAGLRPFEPAKESSSGFWTPQGDYLSVDGLKEWDRLQAKVPIPDRPYEIYGAFRLDLTKSEHRMTLDDAVDDLRRWAGRELNFAHVHELPSAKSLAASETRQTQLASRYRLYSINLPHAVKRVANILEKKARFDLVDDDVAQTLRHLLHPPQYIHYGQ